jgi:hypothetical protein
VRTRQLLGFGMALQEPAPEAARRPGPGDVPRCGGQALLQCPTVLAPPPSPLAAPKPGSSARTTWHETGQQPQQQPCATGQPQLGEPGRKGCRHGPGRRVWLLILGRAGGACSQRPHDRGWGNQPLPTTNGTYRQIHHPRDGNMERCVLRLMAARRLGGDTAECPGNSMQHAAWVADGTTS